MLFVEDGIRWATGALELGLGRGPQASLQFRPIVHPMIMSAAALDGVEAAVLADDDADIDRWVRWTADTAILTDASWAEARLAHARALVATESDAVEILFLMEATNPGVWMAHCHIAEHLEGGMMFTFDVELPGEGGLAEGSAKRV
jgi:hypothetical protein